MAPRPPIVQKSYNQRLQGVYGEFGSGAGLQAFYLQSAITPADLEKISLISDIPGSERWPIRDLFQRDVDNQRVTQSLLPYLEDTERIKFFNPLTLTVLPMDEDGRSVLGQMPRVIEGTLSEADTNWLTLEREKFYRIRWVKDSPEYAQLEWDDSRSKLVAIDGQHRLSSLKRFKQDEAAGQIYRDFMKWRIPVVIVSFRAHQQSVEPPSVLEVVRNIFVYINTQAREVNEARQILLSDESVNSVCVQELLQNSHDNDIKKAAERNSEKVPLLFYDWRGEEQKQKRIHSPAAVKPVEEVRHWFEEYILGEDFSEDQETALGVTPTQPLKKAFHAERLTYETSNELRVCFRKKLLPAISHFFENFSPYRAYIEGLHNLERKHMQDHQNDLAGHAFDILRFGTSNALDSVQPEVQTTLTTIKQQVEALKQQCFHAPLEHDIGMRGVMYAFGFLPEWCGHPDWLDYAEWFTASLNRVYEEGWLDLRPKAKRRVFLLHIIEDHNESIINYRLEKAGDALGNYMALLVAAYGRPYPKQWQCDWQPFLEDCLGQMLDTLRKGYRKQVRPQLRDQYPNGGRELTSATNEEAEKLANRHLRRFEKELDKILEHNA